MYYITVLFRSQSKLSVSCQASVMKERIVLVCLNILDSHVDKFLSVDFCFYSIHFDFIYTVFYKIIIKFMPL